ncbi:hypothetical protein ACQPXB_44205 [Amycolatopsis sp. CA-161197]|uniref:hypothetical protein n=1 Tax=Amycolatopsis sp. CA-161197 TaxID=3239922 RepID=UPI003D947CC0
MVLDRGRHRRLGELFPRLETFASGLQHTTDLCAARALQLGDDLFHGTAEPNDGKRFRLYAVPGDHRSAILDDDVVPLNLRIAIVELHRLGITR